MHVAVIADEAAQKEFQDKQIPQGVQVYFLNTIEEVDPSTTDALFYLKDEDQLQEDIAKLTALQIPLFINAVATTLKHLPSNAIRINAWPGFLLNKQIEICCADRNLVSVKKILNGLHWQYLPVPDIEGMIAPRTIAMIVNEAWFALEEEVSSKEQIDIAMRLGTNYPYGPFEWGEKIGLSKIYNLLKQLSVTDQRYLPAPFLQKEIHEEHCR